MLCFGPRSASTFVNLAVCELVIQRRMLLAHTLRHSFLPTPRSAFKLPLLLSSPISIRKMGIFGGSAQPQYLTGDKAAIDAFVDKFDVCW